MNITVVETHKREIIARLSWAQIKVILAEHIAGLAEVKAQHGRLSNYTVTSSEETEGSPAYRVGFQASVTITENLAEPAPPGVPPTTPEAPRTLSAGQVRTMLSS